MRKHEVAMEKPNHQAYGMSLDGDLIAAPITRDSEGGQHDRSLLNQMSVSNPGDCGASVSDVSGHGFVADSETVSSEHRFKY